MAIIVSDEELSDFKKRFGRVEDALKDYIKVRMEQEADFIQRLNRFDLLLQQLSRHVNPTRDQVTLLKQTNRELAKELKKVHGLLDKQKYNL